MCAGQHMQGERRFPRTCGKNQGFKSVDSWSIYSLWPVRRFYESAPGAILVAQAAELSIRGWTLIQNFAPYIPQTIKKLIGSKSPAERLNQSRYHDNWLHNLLISASLGGYRSPPQIPIQ